MQAKRIIGLSATCTPYGTPNSYDCITEQSSLETARLDRVRLPVNSPRPSVCREARVLSVDLNSNKLSHSVDFSKDNCAGVHAPAASSRRTSSSRTACFFIVSMG